MVVELCDVRRRDGQAAWDDYVFRSSAADHAHLSGWRRVIERSYGHRPLYLWEREGERIRGILPLVLMRTLWRSRTLVSMPFLDDGGICADDVVTRHALLDGAVQMARAHRAQVVDLRHRTPSGLPLPSHGGKVTFVLALESDADRMWSRLDGKVRNQIRKATAAGLSVSWSGIDGLTAFYDVFAVNMRDLGSPVHGPRFFAAILEEFADSAKLVLVRRDGRPIGGGLCLFFRDRVLVPWASSLKEHRSSCPNNLLYWEAIRRACEKGFRQFDFGRSSPGSGTYRFKKQWGGIEHPLAWQRVQGPGRHAAVVGAEDRRVRWAAAVWRRLPVAISRLLGPPLRKHISN
ncbi:MAG: FemAB family XrtA/PEP-CTERM system-associated protein [Candidatus Rokuibacteriota bacterium]